MSQGEIVRPADIGYPGGGCRAATEGPLEGLYATGNADGARGWSN